MELNMQTLAEFQKSKKFEYTNNLLMPCIPITVKSLWSSNKIWKLHFKNHFTWYVDIDGWMDSYNVICLVNYY